MLQVAVQLGQFGALTLQFGKLRQRVGRFAIVKLQLPSSPLRDTVV